MRSEIKNAKYLISLSTRFQSIRMGGGVVFLFVFWGGVGGGCLSVDIRPLNICIHVICWSGQVWKSIRKVV
jgi:hypothetical protein